MDCYPFADYHFRFDVEMITILKRVSENFPVPVAMIECYGSFSLNNIKYVVAPPPTVVSPHTIRLSNLCAIVDDLSVNPNPVFVAGNSIPSAIFDADWLLLNPNDIMPDDYDSEVLLEDTTCVKRG